MEYFGSLASVPDEALEGDPHVAAIEVAWEAVEHMSLDADGWAVAISGPLANVDHCKSFCGIV